MKRFLAIQLVSILLISLVCVSSSTAIGLGFSGGKTIQESNDWTISSDRGDYDSDFDISQNSFGFVLDTAVAQNKVFNYRLNLNYDFFTAEDDWDEYDAIGFSMEHTFGFSFYRNQVVRLWLGPQLRLAYAFGEGESDVSDSDVLFWGGGLGVVFGANFNMGKVFTISPTIGYQRNMYWGIEEDGERYGGYWEDYEYDRDRDHEITESRIFMNVAILFRINDVYK